MAAPSFREKINSRKLLVFLVSLATATGLLANGLIDAETWGRVVLTLGGAYMASQAYVDGKNPT